ncbi:MAG: hypothetical protein H6740_14400 [Alphaproteobacteria bacterium]|nr:hypothetical protein [Alphaproteobacteria bacterium]
MRLLTLLALSGCSDWTWKIPDIDEDGDGYSVFEGDCDDHDANIHPGATDVWYDGVDANCDGLDDFDADGDGFRPPEYVEGGAEADCHDDDPDAYPNSPVEDVWYDCIDQDCDGNDADQDGDGFAAVEVSDGNGGTLLYADTCAALGRDPELVNNAPATDCWDDPDVDFLADYQGEEDLAPEDIFPTEDRFDNETFYDNIDQNCDGWSDFDADGDTYDVDDECDDTNAEAFPDPNVVDVPYNCEDEDCDGQDGDLDDDGFIAITRVDDDGVEHDYVEECPNWADVNASRQAGDCWDDPDVLELPYYPSVNNFPNLGAADVNPGAAETWYDGVDQDCAADNDFDADGDFFNTSEYRDRDLQLGNDCQDADPNANPGAFESCLTDYDDDCDGYINEHGARYDTVDFYYDGDEDGFGDELSTARQGCEDYDQYGDLSMDPQGYTSITNDDCDDSHDQTFPGAAETESSTSCRRDDDEDGYGDDSASGRVTPGTDCNDNNASINTAATEVWYDGVDQDCDDHSDYDADFDGEDREANGGDDCDDTDASINTAATEVWYNGVDQDCDDSSDFDADGDGYDSDNYGGDDCDDTTANINPNRQEVWYNGVDQDCDGLSDYDADVDGFDSDSYGGTDCDDTNAGINTSATEVWYNGVDQDCSGGSDYDADGDGEDSDGYSGADCDDTDASINTSATDTWYDGVDQDCDGASDYDADGDGENHIYSSASSGTTDCHEGTSLDNTSTYPNAAALAPALINAGAVETWYDGTDQDCDGLSDYDADMDGEDSETYSGSDCDDDDIGINTGATEVCDSVDNDCDGDIDDADANLDTSTGSTFYEDTDSDGYGDPSSTVDACLVPSGYVSNSEDCDDTTDTISPDDPEVCWDAVDDDCSGYLNDGCFTADGELVITEIFYASNAGSESWFEVLNDSGGTVDLEGVEFVLRNSSSGSELSSFQVNSSIVMANGDRAVLCKNDGSTTGSRLGYSATLGSGACNYEFPSGSGAFNVIAADLTLEVVAYDDPSDTSSTSVLVDDVDYEITGDPPYYWPAWSSTDRDYSIELSESTLYAVDNDDGLNWCFADRGFSDSNRYYDTSGNPDDRYGTPGVTNTCP